jgi:hypothetical protein
MDKNTQIQDIFKKAELLAGKKVETKEETLPDPKKIQLPSEYVTLSGIMLDSKDVMTNTNFLSKLTLNDQNYKDMTFTPEQAKKIQRELTKSTAGVISATPLTCLGPNCTFASTCIAKGTEVLTYTSKNGVKHIEDLVAGDIIYSFNSKTKEIEHDPVVAVKFMGSKEVYNVVTTTGLSLLCTIDHLVLTERNDDLVYLTIQDGLQVGDKLFLADTEDYLENIYESYGDLLVDTIESIQKQDVTDVYDIEVRKNHNFFANNICVHNCVFQQEGKAPIGQDCIIETNQIKYWMERYIQEFEVDGSSLTDLHMIARLCEYDVLEMRATKYLKLNDQNLLTDFISSFDENGNPITNKVLSPAFELKERVDRMRSKTLKELMATREAKAKILTANGKTSTLHLSDLKEQLDAIIKNKSKIIDVTPVE